MSGRRLARWPAREPAQKAAGWRAFQGCSRGPAGAPCRARHDVTIGGYVSCAIQCSWRDCQEVRWGVGGNSAPEPQEGAGTCGREATAHVG